MYDRNTSRQIRKYVLKQCDMINNTFPDVTGEDIVQLLFNSLDNLESNSELHLLSGYSIPDVIDFSTLRLASLLTRVQMYTDYYRSVKLQDKLFGTRVLDTFMKVNSYEKLKRFSNNEYVQCEMLDSLKEYYDSSAFDKVLFAKCLDEKDVKHLKAINPFFESEYDRCNTDVDLDFMFQNIKNWQNFFPFDIELSYEKAAGFIFDLHKIKKEEAENLLLELFREDLGIISSTDPDEECIKMGQINITEDNLATMFKDYYKFHEKVLKKR